MSKDLHVPGAKDDSGKNRMALVLGAFAPALMLVSKVGTFGANKYTDNGWQTVPKGIARYEDAMLRHYFQYKDGETVDPESGIHHLAHCAWNALAVLTLTLKGKLNASTSGSPVTEPSGKADCQSGAGVLETDPCRADDTSSVFKKWAEQQSRAYQEIHGSKPGIAYLLRQEQKRNEQQRASIPFTDGHIPFPLEGQRVRGSSIDFPADKARAAQAVGQSSPGVAAKHQGGGYIH